MPEAAGEPSPPDAPEGDLERLARHHGLLPSWTFMGGREVRRAGPDALLAVLRALDVPIARAEDAADALAAARAERARRLVEPVAVVWRGEAGRIPLRLLANEIGTPLDCTLVLEDGEERGWSPSAMGPARTDDREERSPTVDLALPAGLPTGYHELRVRVGGRGGREGRTRVIVAPSTAWEPEGARDGRGEAYAARRDFGLFLPLYALRTGRSWGTADLGDLDALLAWAAERGAGFVGTLPLTATFLDEGGVFDPSPYAPVSRLFWSELWLDAERTPGLERAPEAQSLLSSRALMEEVRRLREAPRVRYREAMALKRDVLRAVARAFAPAEEPLPAALAAYLERRPEALRYARFRAAAERRGGSWRAWPADERDGALGPAAGDEAGDEAEDEAGVRYHLWAQWALERQMAALARRAADGPCLYLDLPLGAHPDGYDVWSRREVFAGALSGGAPPDAFFAGGQDWGFPPLHPRRAREDGHAYTAACLRHLMSAAGMLRLDHVMSLHRLFCIPVGHPASDGVYVRYPAEELYAVVCLESHRARCEVVGEDLGTVPDEVRDAMDRHRLRRMYVLPFELAVPDPVDPAEVAAEAGPRPGAGPAGPPDDRAGSPAPVGALQPVPPLSVASLGTHDLPPFAAFWSGQDLAEGPAEEGERRARARWRGALAGLLHQESPTPSPTGGSETSRALTGALELLARSPAEHVLLNAEDLWLETEPQNRPGTTGDENWTRKARYPLEAWSDVPGVEETLTRMREARPRGREAQGKEKGVR